MFRWVGGNTLGRGIALGSGNVAGGWIAVGGSEVSVAKEAKRGAACRTAGTVCGGCADRDGSGLRRGVLSRGVADVAMRVPCAGVRSRVCSRVDTRAVDAIHGAHRSASGYF
jgi:hypothetical protein